MYFGQLKLKPFILETLKNLKINELTKIQEQVIPYVLNHHSVIVTSRTGSGKTLCYLIPILERINVEEKNTQAIIVVPTKELARQIYSKVNEFQKCCPKLKTLLLIGFGENDMERQKKSLINNPPHIIIGTVVKTLELLQQKAINKNIDILVLDEVDMFIDLGFMSQINKILDIVDTPKLQKIACSATTHESLANQLKNYFKDTKVISTSKTIWANQQVNHNIVYLSDNSNPQKTLFALLKNINPFFCIIFCNTKKEAEEIYKKMKSENKNVALLHKDLLPRQRKNVFEDINKNKYQYLVATDLAARGIDIAGADVVISFGLPEDDQWYMHRIGRIGRYKSNGDAFVIYKNGIDSNINRLNKKGINFYYYQIKDDKLVSKPPLKLRLKQKLVFDNKTNNEIKKIIVTGSKKVVPNYKKKIKTKIAKIKQKLKHEYIEKKIKENLLKKNIERSKNR